MMDTGCLVLVLYSIGWNDIDGVVGVKFVDDTYAVSHI